jgi:hypothetical protein
MYLGLSLHMLPWFISPITLFILLVIKVSCSCLDDKYILLYILGYKRWSSLMRRGHD